MNVLQLISSSVGYYGAERVVVTLSAALTAQGAHVVVGAFDNTAKQRRLEVLAAADAHGLDTAVLPCQGRVDRQAVAALRTLVADRKIDVIHSHGPKANLYAYLAARTGTPALVSTCHSWYANSLVERIITATDGVVLTRFDSVVVVSESLRRLLRRRGVRADRVVMINNGIDCAAFAQRPASPARSADTGVVIGTAARLSPEKGLRFLVDAAASVIVEYPNTRFVVAGDGPERDALLAQAARLGLGSRLALLGAQSDMAGFYAGLDVFVLPSLTEGMPMALIEAMAAAKPVAATSVGSVPMLVDDRRNGLLVAPGDATALASALKSLIADRDLRLRLGLRAQVTANTSYSATAMATAYRGVYESVTARARRWTQCAPSVTSTRSEV